MESWPSYLWYEATYAVCAAVTRLGFSLRTAGTRNVPPHGPALLLANHQSFLDPAVVGVAARRHLCFLARKTLFRNPAFGWLIRTLNAAPIDQEGIGIEGLRTVVQQLHAGRAVLVFPEGERTSDGAMHPLKPGIHLLLKRAPVPVVPVGIAGAYDAWPRWRPLPVPAPLFLPAGRATIAAVVGRPLDPGCLTGRPREQVLGELFAALQDVQRQAEQLRRKLTPDGREDTETAIR